MSITAIQESGDRANNATSATKAFASNLQSGSLVVVVGMKYSTSNDPFVSGDCTKSAGTATLGTIAFDVSDNINQGDGKYAAVGIWSAIVTGAGSCTMQVGGATAGSYLLIAVGEYGGNWDAARREASNSKSYTYGYNTPAAPPVSADSNSVTTAGAGLMVAGIQLNTAGGGGITDDAAFASMYQNATGTDDNGSAIRRIVSSGTTDTANWTITGMTTVAWSAAIATYAEAAGGGPAATESRPNPRRNRPGRGPYSVGRYYRPVFVGSTRTPFVHVVSLTESVTAGDSLTSGGAYSVSLAESVALSDAISAVLIAVRTLAESATAGDVISTTGSFGASLAETASASDVLTSLLAGVAALAESVTAGDQLSAGTTGTYSVSLTETTSVADTISSIATLVAALTETAAASDAVSSSATRPASLSEAASVTDTLSASGAIYSVSISESASLSDLVASALIAAGSLSEAAAVTDTVTGGPGVYSVSILEAATAGDTLTAVGAYGLTLAETVTLLDTLSAIGALADAPAWRTVMVSGPSRTVIVQSGGRTTLFNG